MTSGQADAGVVYVTDAIGAGDKVTEVDFPEAPAGREHLSDRGAEGARPTRTVAKRFVDLVTGEAGQKILSQAGFAKP